jgi:hypothetical protein
MNKTFASIALLVASLASAQFANAACDSRQVCVATAKKLFASDLVVPESRLQYAGDASIGDGVNALEIETFTLGTDPGY